MSLQPLAGDAATLRRVGFDYERVAADIRSAIVELRSIGDGDGMIALSLDTMRSDAERVAGEIAAAEPRYSETGAALLEYARELETAQEDADRAIADYESADAAAGDADRQAARGTTALQAITRAPDATESALETATASLQRLAQRSEAAAGERAAALRRYEEARDARDRAAERARSRIDDVVDGSTLNDSLWDDIGGFLSSTVDLIASVVRAIVEAIVAVITAIVVIVLAVLVIIAALIVLGLALLVLLVAAAIAVAAIALLVAVVAVAALLVLVIAAGLAVLAVALIAALLAFVTLKLLVLLTVALDLTVLGILAGKDPYEALVGALIASLVITTPALLAIIGLAAASERPEPVLVDSTDVTKTTKRDQNFSTLFSELADIDKAGHDPNDPSSENADSVVQITTFTAANGETIFRVTIPSTQQWTPGGTSGNDVTSDLVAKMDPAQRTALEAMVKDAMREQGVPDGAHVMLAGWSLGGITAGNLAADPGFNSTYTVDAVVAAGSSLDDIPIPPSTLVLDVSHATDPVARTENPFLPDHGDDANRYKINVPTPPGPSAPFGHDVKRYQDTMSSQVDHAGSGSTGDDFRTSATSDGVTIDDYFGRPVDADQYVYHRG